MFKLRQFFLKAVCKKSLLRLFIVLSVILITAELYLRSNRKYDPSFAQNVAQSIKLIFNPTFFTVAQVIKRNPEDYSHKPFYQFIENPIYDFEYGYRMTANSKSRDILKIKNKLIWNVTFKTDEFGRRVTDAGPLKKNTEQFVVFYGGSRTFGQGVEDHQTLAANFQKSNPDLKVYNYGIMNAAANMYLRYHETGKFKKEIPEKKGTFIYIYDLGHEQKIFGSKEATKSFSSPMYDYGQDDKLAHFHNFWFGRPVRSFIYNFLGLSAVYQNVFLNKRLDITTLDADQLRLIRDVFLEMKWHAAEMSNSNFVVVFFEVSRSPIMDDVSRVLKEAGIEVLYFEKAQLPADDNINYFEFDRHPKASTYVTQAALIQEALKQKSWFKK